MATNPAPTRTASPRRLVLTDSWPDAQRSGPVSARERIPEALGSDRLSALDLGPNGQLLVASGKASTLDDRGAHMHPQRLGVLPRGASPMWLRQADGAPEEVWDGAVSKEWALWAQGASTDLDHLDMELWSHSRVSGTTVHLASSIEVDGRAVSIPGYNRPVIVGGRAYWSDVHPSDSGSLSTAVYSRALDGSDKVHMVESDTYLTTADSCEPTGALLYARTRGDLVQIVRRTPSDARPQVVASIPVSQHARVSDLAACGPRVAYVVTSEEASPAGDEDVDALTLIDAGKPVLVVEGVDGSTPTDPALSRRWLTFSAFNGPLDGGQWLVGVDDLVPYELPTAQGLQRVRLRDDWITWREAGRSPAGPHTTVVGQLRP